LTTITNMEKVPTQQKIRSPRRVHRKIGELRYLGDGRSPSRYPAAVSVFCPASRLFQFTDFPLQISHMLAQLVRDVLALAARTTTLARHMPNSFLHH
jgi:hypothetical protein